MNAEREKQKTPKQCKSVETFLVEEKSGAGIGFGTIVFSHELKFFTS
jgi:hypothetical protein